MDKIDWKLIAATITGLTAVTASIIGLIQKLRLILQPLLRRRTAKIAVLHNVENEESTKDFAKLLRVRGYRDIDLTRTPEALLGRQVVIIWQPATEMAAELVATVQRVTSDATLLILSYDQLPLQRSEGILLSNSKLRLLSDLSALAEGLEPK